MQSSLDFSSISLFLIFFCYSIESTYYMLLITIPLLLAQLAHAKLVENTWLPT